VGKANWDQLWRQHWCLNNSTQPLSVTATCLLLLGEAAALLLAAEAAAAFLGVPFLSSLLLLLLLPLPLLLSLLLLLGGSLLLRVLGAMVKVQGEQEQKQRLSRRNCELFGRIHCDKSWQACLQNSVQTPLKSEPFETPESLAWALGHWGRHGGLWCSLESDWESVGISAGILDGFHKLGNCCSLFQAGDTHEAQGLAL